MKRSKVVAAKPRAPAERADPVVRAVDDVVEDAIDEMVERLTASPDARAVVDPASRKRVRHDFTMSEQDLLTLDALKARLLRLSRPAKKSVLLRAGIAALARMTDERLTAAIGAVPSLKTGRPKSASAAPRSKK